MAIVGSMFCLLAAFRLRDTPLSVLAAVVAVLNVAALSASALWARRGRGRPRAATAFTHVTAALGGFLLFVSFAMPSAP